MPEPTSLCGIAVLVLEDDFYLAEEAKDALEGAGASVLGPFRSEARALEAAEQSPPHCALVDVNLGDGPTFTPARRLLGLGIKVVFLTGYDSSIIPAEMSELPCLQKPVQPSTIVAAVEQVCAG